MSGAGDGRALDSRGVPFTGAGNGPGYYENGGITEATGNPERQWVSTAGPQYNSEVDQTGLQAEIDRRLADQAAQQQAYQDQLAGNNQFGDLGSKFEFDKYTPDKYTAPDPYVADKFSYTGQDLYDDPSYKFRLEQGQKALDRQGAASGRFLSGAQLQSASDYNQGAASQEFQNAYQRALGTFGTNEGNRKGAYDTNTTNGLNAFNVNSANKFNAFNTNETNRYNAYQSNFTNAVNPLLSLAGSATLGSQTLGQQGIQNAQIMGNNLQGAANAQGAAAIAQGNQISGGINNATQGYQSNQLLNQLLNRNNSGSTWQSINNNPIALRRTGTPRQPTGQFLALAEWETDMPLDTSIYNQIQQPQPPMNPLASLAQAYQVKGMQAGIDKADREEQRQNRLLSILQSPEFQAADTVKRQNLVYGAGDIEGATKIGTAAAAANKDQRAAAQTDLDMAIKRHDAASGAFMQLAKDPSQAQQMIGQLVQGGIMTPEYGQKVLQGAAGSPNPAQFWTQGAQASISAKDQIAQQIQQAQQPKPTATT